MKTNYNDELPSLEELQLNAAIRKLGFVRKGDNIYYFKPNFWSKDELEILCYVLPEHSKINFEKKLGSNALRLIQLLEKFYKKEFEINCKYL